MTSKTGNRIMLPLPSPHRRIESLKRPLVEHGPLAVPALPVGEFLGVALGLLAQLGEP